MVGRNLGSCAATLLCAVLSSACNGGTTPNDSGGVTDGGGDGAVATPNPFFPQNLADAIGTLERELGTQASPGDVRLGLIVNGCSNFWNQGQIGTARAAERIGCIASWQCPAGTMPAERQASQIATVDRLIAEGVSGIALSTIDPAAVEPALMRATAAGVNVIVFDSDGIAGSVRRLYVGSLNERAGRAAGDAMRETLGTAGGRVMTIGGVETAPNAIERVTGIRSVLTGTSVELIGSTYDNLDFTRARTIVEEAIDTHADVNGFVGIYAYNGPIILDVLRTRNLLGRYRLVAFDLDPATQRGLQSGDVHAAIGQRPYWWGHLSVFILFAMERLGVDRTLQILRPYLSGPNNDIFDTGQDVVRPDTLRLYQQYLNSIGISSS
jgi:ribose transport system substrate-binding protein